jgi:hypothetical protein
VRGLLDENLDHRLRRALIGHEIFTVTFMGWSGLKNGVLLRTADADGMDVFVTGDQTLLSEVNRTGVRMAIVVLSAIEFRIVNRHLAAIQAALDAAVVGSVQFVDCGWFER